ncbi:HutD/Ves family protein [Noviherbaspirillum pedocola]|uniref:HutD family protein n=1 Tax=Noviherbaspirillum pedocola TaxID=2801341 RepID=A0A934SXF4_9BURK|nr:HutD family protein [Noviherbaspirillum pedocola]MBK4738616.1 HutD family protein [Noviherbaspirillum pedocola]
MMKRFSLDDLPREPWKNGGGTTRTVCTETTKRSASLFDWRVSIADIVESGPFSVFPGIDRIAVVLENGPLRLTKNPPLGQLVAPLLSAERYCPIAFDGGNALFGAIPGEPVLCLNVMTRRSVASATIRILEADTVLEPETCSVLIAADAGWQVGPFTLDKHEGLIIRNGMPLNARAPLNASGPLIMVTIGALEGG